MIRRPSIAIVLAILVVVLTACAGATAPVPSGDPASTEPSDTPGSSVSIATPSATASPATDARSILERARTDRGAPGAIASLVMDGTRTFLSAGAADMAGTRLTETTRFRIASVTKPIVAALILDAVARGELALDDVVGDLLPGVVRATPSITVRQLLDHTSGVFDEGNEGDPVADIERLADPALRDEARRLLARFEAGEAIVTPARVIVALAETHDRYFAPGDGFHYSNANYQIAGMVLEQVTGRTLADLLRSRIVEPLGLRHTSLAPADTGAPELRGYVPTAAGADPVDATDDLSWFGNGGSGGIISTPHETLAILQAIVTARLVPEELVTEMIKPNREWYGLGLATYTFRCGTFYGHNGLVDGTQSTAVVSPDGSSGLVVALDLAGGDAPGLVGLAEAMLCEARP